LLFGRLPAPGLLAGTGEAAPAGAAGKQLFGSGLGPPSNRKKFSQNLAGLASFKKINSQIVHIFKHRIKIS
jgi:hypothetical protein